MVYSRRASENFSFLQFTLHTMSILRTRSATAIRSLRAFSTTPAARKQILDASPADFETHAIKGNRPTIVDFYAE